jgi:phosphoesterase RecJ-like protein
MDKTKLLEIYNKIVEYQKILIFPHARPDGDCIGTSFGLKGIISASFPDKDVRVVGEGSDFTSYIGTPEVLEDAEFKGALAISVDTANEERIGEQRYKLCDYLIKIDHHIPVNSFGDLEYVDTGRPAAALIILDLYMEFKDKLKLTKHASESLFFGILTDTGRFKYSGVNADTFRNVAELYETGLDSNKIYQYLDVRPDKLTRFRGYMLQHYKKNKEWCSVFQNQGKTFEEVWSNLRTSF